MSDHIQVVTTTDNEDHAQQIAEKMVLHHLVACVHIAQITSVYWWDGKTQKDQEWVCTMKTRTALYPEVEKAIRVFHTYDTPEIIATPIINGSEKYLRWLDETTANPLFLE